MNEPEPEVSAMAQLIEEYVRIVRETAKTDEKREILNQESLTLLTEMCKIQVKIRFDPVHFGEPPAGG